MKFTLEIDMGNAAFEDSDFELSRILTMVALRLEGTQPKSGDSSYLLDINGNTVGKWEVAEEKPDVKPRYYWMEFASSDTIYVWKLDANGEMKTVVMHEGLRGRTAKQAVQQELVKRGLMSDAVEMFQL